MDLINYISITITELFLVVMFVSSIYEKEFRAATVSFFMILLNSVFWFVLISGNISEKVPLANIIIISLEVIFVLISSIKYFPKKDIPALNNIIRFDERDHMFSRMNQQNSSRISKKYYKLFPEKEKIDKEISKDPNLGEAGSKFFDKYFSPIANSAFKILDRTANLREGTIIPNSDSPDPTRITNIVKKIAKYYGAVDLGVTELKDHHLYSHHGRQTHNWGSTVTNNHKFGIVIVVKMDQDMMKKSPSISVLLESSKQYVESAKIAHLIAEYIREIGYDATSQVDGNYDVLAVPMAKDAGLGEVGRMGIFIHPKYGPAVRLSVVTTDMPLIKSDPIDFHIEEFCNICKKCALNCPTGSITNQKKSKTRNFEHWSIDQQSCYSFWRKIGTDCGFCIRVCPYTKKDTPIHKLIRFYISRNPINQRIALFMDDIFYGKRFTPVSKNGTTDTIIIG